MRSGRRTTTGILIVMSAGLFPLLSAGSADAAISCSRDGMGGRTLSVVMNEDDQSLMIRRINDTIELSSPGSPASTCSGATVTGVDQITVVAGGAGADGAGSDAQTLEINQSLGGLVPGLSPEPTGAPEIEVGGDLGAGTDVLIVRSTSPGNLRAGMLGVNVNADDDVDLTVAGAESLTLRGSEDNDTLRADGGLGTGAAVQVPVRLVAGNGLNTVVGGAGPDVIEAGGYANAFDGGPGRDTVDYSSATRGVDVNLARGEVSGPSSDSLSEVENVRGTRFSDRMTGDAGANTLEGGTSIDALAGGPGDDDLRGGEDVDVITGGDGDDRIAGGPGDDQERGEAGNDTFVVEATRDGSDLIIGGDGTDTVDYGARTSPVVVTLDESTNDGESGEGDYVVADVENLTGGAGPDALTGSTGANLLAGAGGDDTLRGGAGTDTLDGGAGADTLDGGDGADLLGGGAGSDVVTYADAPSAVTIDLTTGEFAGAAAGDALTDVEGVRATAYDDSLTGDASANRFFGLAGADTLRGGLGDDVLAGGAGSDVLDGGAGADTFDFADLASVTASLASGTATSSGATDTLVAGESLRGSGGADVLTGDAGANTLWGEGSADTLDGGDGADVLDGGDGADREDGGAGDDTFDQGPRWNGGDRLAGGAGTDSVDYRARLAAVNVTRNGVADDGETNEGDDVGADVELGHVAHVLRVARNGTGAGEITSVPAGISCGSDCIEAYEPGARVTLSPVPAADSTFTGWSGDCTGATACVVTMDRARQVTGSFRRNTFVLTARMSGHGRGSIVSSPAGISCGTDCTEEYVVGTTVTLTAKADPFTTSVFRGWTGGGCTGLGSCTVRMTAATEVSARFDLQPPNDDFGRARQVFSLDYVATANTTDATLESAEPAAPVCDGAPVRLGATVWYRYDVLSQGFLTHRIVVDTTGSDFDTVAAVYQGADLGSLSLMACNDNDATSTRSRVEVGIPGPGSYFVQLGGRVPTGGAADDASRGNAKVEIRRIATPPHNDIRSAKTILNALELTEQLDTTGATTEVGERQPGCGSGSPVVGNTVWYRWEVGSRYDQHVTLDTAGSDFDTVIGLYAGTVRNGIFEGTTLACNDDNGTSKQARIGFWTERDRTYYFQVGGRVPAGGAPDAAARGTLKVAFAHTPPPANDWPSGAIAIASSPFTDTRDTTAATQYNDPAPTGCTGANVSLGGVGGTVWYTLDAPVETRVVADTVGSSFNTVLAVYLESSGPRTQVTCRDAFTNGGTARVSFVAEAGRRYSFMAGGRISQGSTNPERGTLVFNAVTSAVPANDRIDRAVAVPSVPFTHATDTRGAATESGETNSCGNVSVGATVWYRYAPAATGSVSVDTFGSGFNTTLQVFSRAGTSLVPVACNDDTGGAQSQVTASVVAGTEYLIQAGGVNGDAGALSLHIGAPGLEGNDHFAGARGIGAVPFSTQASNGSATTETDEPLPCTIGATLWYRLTPAQAQTYLVDLSASDFAPAVAIYRHDGAGWRNLREVACSDTGVVKFVASAGATYYVQAGGVDGTAGNLALRVTASGVVANDRFTDATVVDPSAGITATPNLRWATMDASEPSGCGARDTVWYRFTPTTSLVVRLTTSATAAVDPTVAVYTGTAPSTLSMVDCDGRTGGDRLKFTARAGETYHVQVGIAGEDTGEVGFSLRTQFPDPGDAFADAAVIQQGTTAIHTSNTWATDEALEPHPCGGSATHWYWYVPPSDETISLTTDPGTPAAIAVFTGTTLTNLVAHGCDASQPTVRLKVPLTGGQRYHIQVAGADETEGPIVVRIGHGATPANDAFAAGAPLAASDDRVADTTWATLERGEPTPCGGDSSVWYRFTPAVDATIDLDTSLSEVPAAVTVWTGIQVDDLSYLACADEEPVDRLRFRAGAGRTYHIQLTTHRDGVARLHLRSNPPPANDAGEAAQVISTLPAILTADTTWASLEDDENAICGGENTLWYRFDPEEDTVLDIRASSSTGAGPIVAVYEGEQAPRHLEHLSCGEGDEWAVRTTPYLQAGRSYFIQVASATPAPISVRFRAG